MDVADVLESGLTSLRRRRATLVRRVRIAAVMSLRRKRQDGQRLQVRSAIIISAYEYLYLDVCIKLDKTNNIMYAKILNYIALQQ